MSRELRNIPKMVQGHSVSGRTLIFELISPKFTVCKVFLCGFNQKTFLQTEALLFSVYFMRACVCVCEGEELA